MSERGEREKRERRYREIMGRLGRLEVSPQEQGKVDEPATALDAIGAMHLVERYGRGAIEGWYGYGPKVIRDRYDDWLAVLGWWKRNSFYAFERLKLLGIWAQRCDDGFLKIVLGERELAFRGSFHNPESLHQQLKADYRSYYVGGRAPPSKAMLVVTYEASQRLAIRLRLEKCIGEWAKVVAAQSSRQ